MTTTYTSELGFSDAVKATISGPTAGRLDEAEATRRVARIKAHSRPTRPSTTYRATPDWNGRYAEAWQTVLE